MVKKTSVRYHKKSLRNKKKSKKRKNSLRKMKKQFGGADNDDYDRQIAELQALSFIDFTTFPFHRYPLILQSALNTILLNEAITPVDYIDKLTIQKIREKNQTLAEKQQDLSYSQMMEDGRATELENELQTTFTSLLQVNQGFYENGVLEDFRTDAEEIEGLRKNISDQIRGIQRSIENKKDKINEATEYDKLKAMIDSFPEEMETKQTEISLIQTQINQLLGRPLRDDIQRSIFAAQKQKATLEKELVNRKQFMEQQQSSLDVLTSKQKHNLYQLKLLQAQLVKLSEKLSSLESSMEPNIQGLINKYVSNDMIAGFIYRQINQTEGNFVSAFSQGDQIKFYLNYCGGIPIEENTVSMEIIKDGANYVFEAPKGAEGGGATQNIDGSSTSIADLVLKINEEYPLKIYGDDFQIEGIIPIDLDVEVEGGKKLPQGYMTVSGGS